MSIGKWIRAKATANAPLVALIGTRIHPLAAPQETALPYVVYTPEIEPRDVNKVQAATADRCRVVFTFAAADFDTCEDINDALRTVFDFGEGTANGVTVNAAYYMATRYSMDETMEYYIGMASYEFDLKR